MCFFLFVFLLRELSLLMSEDKERRGGRESRRVIMGAPLRYQGPVPIDPMERFLQHWAQIDKMQVREIGSETRRKREPLNPRDGQRLRSDRLRERLSSSRGSCRYWLRCLDPPLLSSQPLRCRSSLSLSLSRGRMTWEPT